MILNRFPEKNADESRPQTNSPKTTSRPMCATASCTKHCAGCGSYWSRRVFRTPGVFLGKRHQNTRRGRVTAPADLETPNRLESGFGFGLGPGLGSGWSGSTRKLENDDTRLAHSVRPRRPINTHPTRKQLPTPTLRPHQHI